MVLNTGRISPPEGDVVARRGGGRQDWAQVYSTVHVSPVWLRGWRHGPVGVTTEAGVCKGREEGEGEWGRRKG